jgi:hypothetical protein
VEEIPWPIVVAVNQALTVISWHENLPRDEQPPRHIWHSPELVELWFKDVEEARNSKYGGGKKKSSYEEADNVPMTSNELTDKYRPK